MKKISVLLISGASILVVGCQPAKKVRETTAATFPSIPTLPVRLSDTIAFQLNYTSKAKKTNLRFTKAQIDSLVFLNSTEFNLDGNVFSENLEVKNGSAYVKNSTLAGLNNIPALSVWKADTSKLSIGRDENKIFWIKVVNKRKAEKENVRYIFYIGQNSDSTFSFKGTPWKMVYGGSAYDVTSVDKPSALYVMVDTVSTRLRNQ